MVGEDGQMTTEDILALIEAGPAASTSAQLAPIGVPAAVAGPDGTAVGFEANGVEPQYFDGDQYALLAAMSPEDLAQLQYLMKAAGVIPKGATYLNGRMDDVTITGWATVLSHANRSGMNAERALSDLANAEKIGSEGDDMVAPYLKPDPAKVRQAVKAKFSEIIGRDVTDDELGNLADTYLKMDAEGYQTDLALADAAETGAGVVQEVDPASRFEELLESRYRPEIERREGVLDMAKQRESLMSNVFALDQYIA